MPRLLTVLTLSGFLALTLAPGSAEASRASDYRSSMLPFFPVIEGWAEEAAELTRGAQDQPLSVPRPELRELVLRGRSIADDLRGSRSSAPVALQGRHRSLHEQVSIITAALQRLEAGEPASWSEVEEARIELRQTLRSAQNLLRRQG